MLMLLDVYSTATASIMVAVEGPVMAAVEEDRMLLLGRTIATATTAMVSTADCPDLEAHPAVNGVLLQLAVVIRVVCRPTGALCKSEQCNTHTSQRHLA